MTTDQNMLHRDNAFLDQGEFSIRDRWARLRDIFAGVVADPSLKAMDNHGYFGAAPFTGMSGSLLFRKACGSEFVVRITNHDGRYNQAPKGFEYVSYNRETPELVAHENLDARLRQICDRASQWAAPTLAMTA